MANKTSQMLKRLFGRAWYILSRPISVHQLKGKYKRLELRKGGQIKVYK